MRLSRTVFEILSLSFIFRK